MKNSQHLRENQANSLSNSNLKRQNKNCFTSSKTFQNKVKYKMYNLNFIRDKNEIEATKLKVKRGRKKFGKPAVCVFCRDILSSLKTYIKHYNDVHGIQIDPCNLCKICGRKSPHRHGHLDHMIAKHTEHKPYRCQFCDKQWAYSYCLRNDICRNNKNCTERPTALIESRQDFEKLDEPMLESEILCLVPNCEFH